MAGYYDSVDLKWDNNGDYLRGENGDFADTSADEILSLESEIRCLVKSSLGDWELHPNLAAQLKDYVGRPNTRNIGKAIESRLRSALTLGRLVSNDDIKIRVIPVRYDAILVMLTIDVYATEVNRLEAGEPIVISFLMDLSEGQSIFIDKKSSINLFPVGE